MTDVFSEALRLLAIVARSAEAPAGVFHEAYVGERCVTQLTDEAGRVPVVVHRLDHPTDDKFLCDVTSSVYDGITSVRLLCVEISSSLVRAFVSFKRFQSTFVASFPPYESLCMIRELVDDD